MNRVKHIELNLNTFKIALQFENATDPLILHFDTPSRKFYFALITLIVYEMKQQDNIGYVYIRKHEKRLKFLDEVLAGSHASNTIDGMWEKIRKSWHYSLPILKEAAHFKIEHRDIKPPYEKGGKYLYDCTEEESDIWANFFGIDEISNKWRFKFAFDTAGLKSDDVTTRFGKLQNDSAWKAFLKHLEGSSKNDLSIIGVEYVKSPDRIHKKQWLLYTRVIVVAIILFVGGFSLLNHYLRPATTSIEESQVKKTSIAVLPFMNISKNPDQEYFCDGITEELINNLARAKDLRVISRTSSFYFKDKSFDLKTIGEKLGVENILEGSVRVSGDNLRISAQLINVLDDSHLWTETIERKMIDIFETQEELAQEIACTLISRLGCEEIKQFSKNYTDNLEAYNLYLKGLYFQNRFSFEKAIEYFNQTISVAPNYARAYAGLASAYTWTGFVHGEAVNSFYLKAKAAVLKALEIDDMLAEAYTSMGQIKYQFEWDWDGAEASFKRAIELSPSNSQTHFLYNRSLSSRGLLDNALREIKLALVLDPFALNINRAYGVLLRKMGEVDSAIHQFEKTLELFPDNPNTLLWLGMCYLEKREFAKAFMLIEKVLNHPKAWRPFALSFAGYAYGLVGRTERALEILDEVLNESKKKYFPPHLISLIYNGLGDEKKMYEYLEKAHNQKDPFQFTLKTIPMFKKYHSDPRFISLLKRMGLDG